MPSYSPAFRRGKNSAPLPFAVWSAVPDHTDSTRNTWDYLNRVGKIPHLLWNPGTGDVVEGISMSRTATLLPTAGIQMAVICSPEDPFTSREVCGSDLIFKALESLGVPEVWPFGPPSILGTLLGRTGASLAPGHYSADQISPDWTGVGPIDIRRIRGAVA